MKCDKWERDISAFLDGGLESNRVEELERHIAGCTSCAAFKSQHQKLGEVFARSAKTLIPPDRLWRNIEIAIEAQSQKGRASTWDRFRQFFTLQPVQFRRLAYTSFTLLTLLAVLVGRFVGQGLDADEERCLAKLDAFSYTFQGNPFASQVATENPFFSALPKHSSNPFRGRGSSIDE